MRNLKDARRVLKSFINRLAEERNTFAAYPFKGANNREAQALKVGHYDELIETARGVLEFVEWASGQKNDVDDFFAFVHEVCRVHDAHGVWATAYGDPNTEAAREWAEDAAPSVADAGEVWLDQGPHDTAAVREHLLKHAVFSSEPKPRKRQQSIVEALEALGMKPNGEGTVAHTNGVGANLTDAELRREVARMTGLPEGAITVITVSQEGVNDASS